MVENLSTTKSLNIQKLLLSYKLFCSIISRFQGNHQKIFEFSLREEDGIVKLVLLFTSFLLLFLVITLLVVSPLSNHYKSGEKLLLDLLYWLSKQTALCFCLLCSMKELTTPRLANVGT